jgi:hypothetical protein
MTKRIVLILFLALAGTAGFVAGSSTAAAGICPHC